MIQITGSQVWSAKVTGLLQGSSFSFIVIIQYRIAQGNAVVALSTLHTQNYVHIKYVQHKCSMKVLVQKKTR